MKRILLLTWVLLPVMALAQPTGYLGKRASIYVKFSSGPALWGPTKNDKGILAYDASTRDLGLNTEWEFGLSYAVERYKSLTLINGYYRTGLGITAFLPNFGQGEVQFNYNDSSLSKSEGSCTLLFSLRARSVGILYNVFRQRKGALAPMGNLFYLGFKRTFVKIALEESRSPELTDFIFDPTTGFNSLMIGWNNNQVFFDRVILKTGIRLNVPLHIRMIRYNVESINIHPDYDTNRNSAILEVSSLERLFRHELARFELGLGLLLF